MDCGRACSHVDNSEWDQAYYLSFQMPKRQRGPQGHVDIPSLWPLGTAVSWSQSKKILEA